MRQFQQTLKTSDIFADKTVLIVDENAMLRQVIGEIFHNLRCNVLAAANGQEAIAHIRQNNEDINLVLLGLDTAILGGDDVYGHMRSEAPGVKVIILSSYHEEEVKERLNQNQIIPFLRKPFSMLDLIDQAQALLVDFPNGKLQN